MHRRSLVLLVLLVVAAVPAFANHSWGNYHWGRTANPLNLKMGDNMTTSSWRNKFNTAVSDWNQSSKLNLTVVTGQSRGKCRPTAGRDEICNGAYGNNGWLGLAQIWLSGGHISQGTAKMNDSYVMNQAEQQHVICQEVGHTFGLGHTSEDGSSQNTCMDYYQNQSDNDTTSTHPNAHDYAQLDTIYAHLDSVNTAFASVAAELSAPLVVPGDELDQPWRWGNPVAFDQEGRANVYVLDRGDGEAVVTRVIWASRDHEPVQPDRQR